MAGLNTKVTDFFVSRKRVSEAHRSKRQKLSDLTEVFKKPHQTITNVSEASSAKRPKKSSRAAVKSSTRKSRKTNFGTQLTLSDSLQCLNDKGECSITPKDDSSLNLSEPHFDFKVNAIVPSDCDSMVKAYDTQASPRSTPTKRSSKQQIIPTKRKRAPGDGTPETEIISSDVNKKIVALRKLDMPSSEQLKPRVEIPSAPIIKNMPCKMATSQSHKVKSDRTEHNSVTPNTPGPDSIRPNAIKAEVITSDTTRPDVNKPDASCRDTAELKAKLSKCGKLSDLKACLRSVRNIKAKIKEKKNNSTPVSESAEASNKSCSTPAYVKYKDLSVKIPATLTLPYKYKILEDMFKGTDTIISIMYNRVERCTFDKLKRAVQEMLRKNFEPKHLGQIKSVFPESYELRQEVGIVEAGLKSKKYQLTVEPILEVPEKAVQVAKRKDGRPVFGSGEVIRRKESFRRRLFDIVKSHHQSFLEKLKPAVKVDSQKLTRWHPKFLLEEVPEVQPSPLPEAPEAEKELITAKDVLSKARGKVPRKVEQALLKVADATEKANNLRNLKKTAEENKLNVKKAAAGIKPTLDANSSALNKTAGISSALLDRIRAKESLKAKAAMLRDETTEQEIAILGRLPEMIKILRSHFITEKKAALGEDSVIVKLTDSYKSSISQGSVEKHVDYLLECLPDWISRVSISTGKYIKINRQTELSQLNERLKELLRQKQYLIPDVMV
ncbi:DNA replication factor Cdt1-like [Watersipora subatra]|uniref:DNA replication factor Cdt1-like n=1 Tax=Watersipora subatra TaxID=2589382 RepID=UPI00355C3530